MIRAVVVAAVALLLSAAAAFSFAQTPSDIGVAIDLNSNGNSGNSLGPTDACRSVNVGESFPIDVVVKNVPQTTIIPPAVTAGPSVTAGPTGTAGGISGFGLNLHYDPSVINVTAADNGLMIGSLSPFERIVANYVALADPNPFPSTNGNLRIDYLDFDTDHESGDGILSRLTISVVGPGKTTLHLDSAPEIDPLPYTEVLDGNTSDYQLATQQDAVIKVGSPCDQASQPTPQDVRNLPTPSPYGATPTPSGGVPGESPTPAPGSPTATPPSAPAGDTSVSVDAIPTDNTATSVGHLDTCAEANVGDTFQVDVVVQKVQNLLGWDAPISYDPAVLKVIDRDVKLFQAANQGSHVFDASNQTPSDTGIYRAGAVDQADPPSPDSGSGVLIRLTFEAIGEGISPISLNPVDLNRDGTLDTGLVLKNTDTEFIGGPIFNGATSDSIIRVGQTCPNGAKVVKVAAPSATEAGNIDTDSGSSNTWVFVVAGVAIAVLAAGALGYLVMRRRGGDTPPPAPPMSGAGGPPTSGGTDAGPPGDASSS